MLIKHCFLTGKILFKQSNGLISVIRTLLRWKQRYTDFKRGRTGTNDAERSGCRNSAIVQENTKKLYKLVLADRKLKLLKIAEEWKVSEGNVFTILYEHLSMRKLCLKWVLHLLTVDQKQKHVENFVHCLQLFQRNKKWEVRKSVTMDETWIHHFTSNWQSAERTAAGESFSRQGLRLRILGYARYFVHRLPWERKNHQ